MRLDSILFLKEAKPVTGNCPVTTASLRFKASFGISVEVCIVVWNKYIAKFPNATHKHLLWGIYFLKTYPKESVAAALFGTSEKTFRKHTRVVVERIGSLVTSVVSKEFNPFLNKNSTEIFVLTFHCVYRFFGRTESLILVILIQIDLSQSMGLITVSQNRVTAQGVGTHSNLKLLDYAMKLDWAYSPAKLSGPAGLGGQEDTQISLFSVLVAYVIVSSALEKKLLQTKGTGANPKQLTFLMKALKGTKPINQM